MRPLASPQPDYSWLPPKKPKDYVHEASAFSRTGVRPNEFVIHPDWISETSHSQTPFGRRRFRPWAFEYQGARHEPWGSVEQKIREEHSTRRLLEADPCPQEANPPPPASPARLPKVHTSEHTPAWSKARANTAYSRHLYTGDYAHAHAHTGGVHSGSAEPFGADPDYAEYFSHSRHPPYNEPLPGFYTRGSQTARAYDPVAYDVPPTPAQRARAMCISKSSTFQPHSGRPRFDRPYMNFANATWIPQPSNSVAY